MGHEKALVENKSRVGRNFANFEMFYNNLIINTL